AGGFALSEARPAQAVATTKDATPLGQRIGRAYYQASTARMAGLHSRRISCRVESRGHADEPDRRVKSGGLVQTDELKRAHLRRDGPRLGRSGVFRWRIPPRRCGCFPLDGARSRRRALPVRHGLALTARRSRVDRSLVRFELRDVRGGASHLRVHRTLAPRGARAFCTGPEL